MMENPIDALMLSIREAIADRNNLHSYTLCVTQDVYRRISQCVEFRGDMLYFCGIRIYILKEKDALMLSLSTSANAFLVRDGMIYTSSGTYSFNEGKLFFNPLSIKNDTGVEYYSDENKNTAIEDFLNSIPKKKEADHAAE